MGRYTGTAGFEAVPPDILRTYGEYSGTNFHWRPYYKIDSRYDPLDITLHQRDVWGSDSKPPGEGNVRQRTVRQARPRPPQRRRRAVAVPADL